MDAGSYESFQLIEKIHKTNFSIAGVYECTADNMYSIDRRSFKTDFSIAFD